MLFEQLLLPKKKTDAKNFIVNFIRPRVTLNCDEISFDLESWTFYMGRKWHSFIGTCH